jgi:hypothetical protein
MEFKTKNLNFSSLKSKIGETETDIFHKPKTGFSSQHLVKPTLNLNNPKKEKNNKYLAQNGDGTESVSIRLIDEILEIFVPPEKFASRANQREERTSMTIPYGLNRLLPKTSRSRDLVAERGEEREMGQIIERRFSPTRQSVCKPKENKNT